MFLRARTGGRSALAAAAVLLAITALLAGCGTVPDRPAAAGSARITAAGRKADARITVAAAGSYTEAKAVAVRLLAALVLPAGAARLRQQAVPAALQTAGFTGAGEDLDLYRYYRLPMPMAAADSFLQAHPPAGLTLDTTGTVGLGNDYLAGSPRSLPPGISAVMLQYIMATVPGGSLLRADVQVMFYPPRTAAEYLSPARFRSVTVSAVPWDSPVPASQRTITSRRDIAMLAALVNLLPVKPPGSGPISCPFIGGNMVLYQLEFNPVPNTGPTVVVKSDGCLSDLVSADGVRQPPLEDGDTVATAAARLLKAGS